MKNQIEQLTNKTVKIFTVGNSEIEKAWINKRKQEWENLIEKCKLDETSNGLYNLGLSMLQFNKFKTKYGMKQAYTEEKITEVLDKSLSRSKEKEERIEIRIAKVDNYWFNYKWNTAEREVERIEIEETLRIEIEQEIELEWYRGKYWQEFVGRYEEAERVYSRAVEKLENIRKNKDIDKKKIAYLLLKTRFKQGIALSEDEENRWDNKREKAIKVLKTGIQEFDAEITEEEMKEITCEYIEIYTLSYHNLINIVLRYADKQELKKIMEMEENIRHRSIIAIKENKLYDEIEKDVILKKIEPIFNNLHILINKAKEAYL